MTQNVWTTKDGRKLLPHEFEDGHLLNTLRLIERWAAAALPLEILACYQGMGMVHGEMAMDAVDHEIRWLETLTPQKFAQQRLPIYRELKAEAERRNLSYTPTFKGGGGEQ